MTSNRRFPKSRLFIVELPIVGLFILALVGWVYWLALKEWKRRKEYRYAGAVAIIGFIGVTAFIVAMGFSVAHVFRSAHIAKERTDCVQNLNSMGRAMLMYLSDNNDGWPE